MKKIYKVNTLLHQVSLATPDVVLNGRATLQQNNRIKHATLKIQSLCRGFIARTKARAFRFVSFSDAFLQRRQIVRFFRRWKVTTERLRKYDLLYFFTLTNPSHHSNTQVRGSAGTSSKGCTKTSQCAGLCSTSK